MEKLEILLLASTIFDISIRPRYRWRVRKSGRSLFVLGLSKGFIVGISTALPPYLTVSE